MPLLKLCVVLRGTQLCFLLLHRLTLSITQIFLGLTPLLYWHGWHSNIACSKFLLELGSLQCLLCSSFSYSSYYLTFNHCFTVRMWSHSIFLLLMLSVVDLMENTNRNSKLNEKKRFNFITVSLQCHQGLKPSRNICTNTPQRAEIPWGELPVEFKCLVR